MCILNCTLFLLCISQAKIPDIEKCLDIVATLQARKGTGEVRCCSICIFAYAHSLFAFWVAISLILFILML